MLLNNSKDIVSIMTGKTKLLEVRLYRIMVSNEKIGNANEEKLRNRFVKRF